MKRSRRDVPSFALYGEAQGTASERRLHIEDIQSRSRKYQWEIAAHTHRGLCQCVFILHGPAAVSVDDAHTKLQGPALALLPPATVHAFRFSGETHGYVLTVAPEALFEGDGGEFRAAFQTLFAMPRIIPLEADGEFPARLQRLLERLLEEFRTPDSLTSPVCTWLARSVLWIVRHELARRHGIAAGTHRRHRSFAHFRTLLETHYLDHWPVTRYARTLGLTEGRLNRLCQAQSDHSAFCLLQQRLVLEARRRLSYVAIPISQVARELGFRDPAYFCRFFKRHGGVAPRQFRQRSGAPGG
jgi:AraC family transcriptional activator of pobA